MLRSMTGFGRSFLEDADWTQTWEVRSVNGRHLDMKWRLPVFVRNLEPRFEKVVRKFATRGRVDISLGLQLRRGDLGVVGFNDTQATAMLDTLSAFAAARGDAYSPDYNRMLGLSFLWEDAGAEPDEELLAGLESGLAAALADWNESRAREAKALAMDMTSRLIRMDEWVARIEERAPDIKEERFQNVRDRLSELLERAGSELDEGRFLQEITLLADKLDVSEELTRLRAHLDRLRELMAQGGDAGKRLDFTLQECFREINTCGNKIQDAQISRLVVDFKNELEKCREQVQNIE
ncbi:YicC family protein [Nitratidesulfovibrio sp. HK-II]|uniref:YicC/YloC family endoribonuclease n=1 Tax=Nitratidesulfovibrio sp. HK-II TaxID=2009266 RepID=UPI000E2EFFD0|nr:YicC/YloC family endoribonuclease [Nitratidesulfovibrio sp. HK-II]GBO95218.1 protein YicC [Nitratidesulfovibrio sp. HK-II]